MTTLRAYLAVIALVAGCSGPDTPEDPTWADVQPILATHCVRCHGAPASSAPDGFRLDVYDDTIVEDFGDDDPTNDWVIRGAGTMAEFLAERTDPEEAEDKGFDLMPPTDTGLDGRQTAILRDWDDLRPVGGAPPERGERADNRAPTITRLDDVEDGDRVGIAYQIEDADHDLVRGQLLAGGVAVGELHGGRGLVTIDRGVLASGSLDLQARLDDGGAATAVVRELGSVIVDHVNAAPSIRIVRPGPFAILHDRDADPLPVYAPVRFDIGDADGDAVTYTARAIRGAQVVVLADGAAAEADGVNEVIWDFTALPAGPGWRLEVTATDGRGGARTATSPAFRISHAATAETAAGLADVLAKCDDCHGAESTTGVQIDFASAAWDSSFRGRLYRRFVDQASMPPPSAPVSDRVNQAERDRVADWLLGGAPE